MIAFATLFLGLITGAHPVELVVGDRVAAVELRLDGELVSRLTGPPWVAECDLGEELAPHELVAVARDAEGAEIGRVRQWVNLPHDLAESHIVLEGGEEGRGVVARLTWASISAGEPVAVRVTLDGRPVQVEDPRAVSLPDHDPDQLHFLRAELDFPENVSSVAEITFGGTYSDQVATELTAVPVEPVGRRRLPGADAFGGRFVHRGDSVPVLGVEDGPAQITVVVAREASEPLDRFAAELRRASRHRGWVTERTSPRFVAPLSGDQRVRFFSPFPERVRHGLRTLERFPRSRELTRADGGFYWLVFGHRPTSREGGEQRLADAVAVAGMGAAARDRRRSVVVLVGAEVADASSYDPTTVSRYLSSLHVPLFVWTTAGDVREVPGWGPVGDASSLGRLERRFRELSRALARQRIVWLEGDMLPHEIALADPGAEMRIAR